MPRTTRWIQLLSISASLGAPCAPLGGCAIQDDLTSTSESNLTDQVLIDVGGIAAPSHYGKYCSVTDPTNGGWAFTWSGATGDPCGSLEPIVGPATVIRRAGLWDMTGNNNAMVQCDNGVYFGRSYGEASLNNIFHNPPPGSANCVFTISPTHLPAFGYPYSPSATVTGTTVHDYDWRDRPWNVADFGHTGSNACGVDRTGTQTYNCGSRPTHTGNPYGAVEAAYDWSMARDTPVLAVADGIVRASVQRTVWPLCGTWADGVPRQSLPFSPQLELFLETQVGSGRYAEHFVAAYHHMDGTPSTITPAMSANYIKWGGQWLAPAGTVVKKGDVIGYIGESGCSSGGSEGDSSYHLDLSVIRLTNLSGARSYPFQALPTVYDSNNNAISGVAGVNGGQGVIDPFGWAAPSGVDPGAYKYLGLADPYNPPSSVTQDGAFSIALWDVGVSPPHNGGAAW